MSETHHPLVLVPSGLWVGVEQQRLRGCPGQQGDTCGALGWELHVFRAPGAEEMGKKQKPAIKDDFSYLIKPGCVQAGRAGQG